jgi:hypothetical protein
MERALPLLPQPAVVVGEIVAGRAGEVTVVDSATGEQLGISRGGWDHFSPARSES